MVKKTLSSQCTLWRSVLSDAEGPVKTYILDNLS